MPTEGRELGEAMSTRSFHLAHPEVNASNGPEIKRGNLLAPEIGKLARGRSNTNRYRGRTIDGN
jgi:hypothetical protein